MIFNFTNNTNFYLFYAPVDMRKGIHSLYHLVKTFGKMDALSGDAYIFIARNRKSIKILRWQKEGFVLYHKKLELGRYTLPPKFDDEPFPQVKSATIDHLVRLIKHKSGTNELRQKVLSTL